MCFQEDNKDKKPGEVKTPHSPEKLAGARSVFENGASEKSISNKKEKLFPPPKPPRVAAVESYSEEKPEEQQQPAKRKAPSPPKETKESSDTKVVDRNTTSVIKRKAPEPPTSNQEESKIHPGPVKAISCDGSEVKAGKACRGEKVISVEKTGKHNKKENVAEKFSTIKASTDTHSKKSLYPNYM